MKLIKEKAESFERFKPYFVFVLLAGSVMLVFIYTYLIAQTIFDTSKMKSLSANLTALSARSSDLESKYIELKRGVTLEVAHSLGFKDAETPKFVAKKTLGSRISLNNEI